MTHRTAEPATLEELVEGLLAALGEDPKREGLLRTPGRVARSLSYLTSGYRMDLEEIVNGAIFHEDAREMVLVRDIEFYSLCEHHLLPFYGRAHVAYLPEGRVIGLSKLPRIVEMFARRLQVQERMTTQIAEAVQEVLQPSGVGVVVESSHLCMMMRGVAKQSSKATTSCLLGAFRDDPRTRGEFLSLVRGG
ncbi:MAG: GTP cyclohydrolase I FolE [Planctomycetota bacterium]|nr:MAG: GTP cyclohydrolase I FolE [Planctomycetota bacterium]